MILKEKKKINQAFLLSIFFIISSFLGWCLEQVIHLLRHQEISYDVAFYQLTGLKIPFLIIYGFGGLMMIFLSRLMERYFGKDHKYILLKVFAQAVMLIIYEFIIGFISLYFIHYRYWDYSGEPFNFLGIISIYSFLGWFILSGTFEIIKYFINKKNGKTL